MLEGLEISVVKLSELNNEFRIDAEYFSKTNLKLLTSLKNYGCISIFNVANSVTDGIHTSIDYDENSSINLISAGSPKENIFDLSRNVYISEKAHKENPRTALRKNDVVISTVGTIGNCAVVDESVLPANSDRHVGIVRLDVEKYSPYVLSTFLLSKYGRMQTWRESTGNVQLSLFLYKIRELLIPIFPDSFQSKIESLVKSAHAKLEESKSLYSQAEDLLLSELGLKDWQPKNTLHTTKKFSDFTQSGRLDAEYYQTKYDDLFEKLSKVECKTIKEIQIINYRGFQPEYVENGEIDVINSKHILEDGLDYDNFEKTDEISFNKAARSHVTYGDVLTYTTGANIGRTQVYLSEKKAMASNHVNMLRVKDVNPIYLALVLNSKIGRMQTEKLCTGSAQVELYPDDLASFIIPILPEQIQTKIASFIQQSFECKAQSKQLLEDAKRMVEEEIEK